MIVFLSFCTLTSHEAMRAFSSSCSEWSVTYATAISACQLGFRWKYAMALQEKAAQRRLRVSIETSTAVVDCLSKCANWQVAQTALSDFQHHSFHVGRATSVLQWTEDEVDENTKKDSTLKASCEDLAWREQSG